MRNTIAIVTLIFCAVYASILNATNQEPDKFIVNGKTYSLNKYPLEEYFELNPDKRPGSNQFYSTALRRRYIATWEIVSNEMLLRKVEFQIIDAKREYYIDKIKSIFPDTQKIVASWYSGTLIIPDGESGVISYDL